MLPLPNSLDELRRTWVVGIPLKLGQTEGADYAVHSSAKLYADTERVDATRKFWVCADQERQQPPKGFRTIRKQSLNAVDDYDTLVIVSHGNENVLGHWPQAEVLAKMLNLWGLRLVGELRIAACLVGKGNYLPDLKKALTELGIGVKKFVAFTESVETTRSWGGKAIETAGFVDGLFGKEWYRVEIPGNL
jgi:hypothetical protein